MSIPESAISDEVSRPARDSDAASQVDSKSGPLAAQSEFFHARTLEGLEDVNAGRLIGDDAMKRWADSLGTDHELPVPQPD